MLMLLPLGFLIDLEYMPGWKAALIFGALAAPIVLLGMRSLAGLGAVRKWVAIALRLLVLLMLVLILAGARWNRMHKDVQVMVVRDNSQSTMHVRSYPGRNLDESIEDYLRSASDPKHKIHRDDRIGVISFDRTPLIDSMPNTTLLLDARAIRDKGNATDMASAIQLALATFQKDAMRRILLVSDGNQTAGDLEGALAAAVSQGVPIDVMKLSYNVNNEVLIDRLSAPSWKRESDPFDIFISLISTNIEPVTGTLTVLEESQRLEQRRITLEPATINAEGKIEPKKHVERVRVPALKSSGVRRFKSTFEPDVVNSRTASTTQPSRPGDTLLENNTASAFTFVQGQGRILHVDNTRDGAGKVLEDALRLQAINVESMNVDQVPEDLVALQNYDAIILNNVPHGRTPTAGSGLSDKHDAVIASYVHDFGGGLIMVGGPDSFGAGGWQGTKIEEVLPVNMDIPAQRQMPKGALVLVIHSCEMPDGNYWGEQCAIKAVETLSAQDDIGVISFGWGGGARGGGVGGSSWDYELAPKGDGTKVIAAIKRMAPGDMPSFDDCLELAVNGAGPGAKCLKNSNAAQKHIIIVSDGDPSPPQAKLMQQILATKISVSTVSVYPHQGMVPPTMQQIAQQTGGRFYGPIEKNPNQLPQIFIKEATVVRRTLLQESKNPPITVSTRDTGSDIMKGVPPPPPIYGLVLSAKKMNPTIEMPLVASLDGKNVDPLFAHWQAGLGKSAAFTSDASPVWDGQWLSPQYSGSYGKFWTQMVRGVSRPPMSTDFSTTTERIGDRARVTVEVTNKEAGFTNFLNIRGTVVDPEGKQHEVRLVQSGPGTYVTDYPITMPGNYVVALRYSGGENKQGGWLISGLAVNDSPETRELKSNDGLLDEIAERTKGRVIPAFDAEAVDIFSRENLPPSASPLPVWDILLPILLGLILVDVAARRIAWDWQSTRRMALAVADRVRSFTVARQIEAKPTLDALKRVRDEVVETKFKTGDSAAPLPSRGAPAVPNPRAKFEATGVEGDISQVVGGATNRPIPSAPKKPEGAGAGAGPGYTGSLLEAKRRAQQKIKEKEQGDE
ncbi:MAG TPA: glutamine amidotransferase [Tepidisphaeraceae bacterium]|nr:glutamine amidotransferase [Tepidisphaeraceae bacterium]